MTNKTTSSIKSAKTIALYHADSDYTAALIQQFKKRLPQHNVQAWAPDMAADYLVSWKPEPKIFTTRDVKVIFALGAGVDAFLAADLPEGVPLVRLEEAGMGAQMLEMALYGILHYARDMIVLNNGRRNKQWLGRSTPKRAPFSTQIGVMGMGQLGRYVAEHLAQLGYPVSGYSRTRKDLPSVTCYDDSDFDAFLAQSEVLINLLPLTQHTQDLVDAKLFAKLPQGAYFINLARGKHVIEEDLLAALNSGQLSGALLDVFRVEPLPAEHPFWNDECIVMTPHLAAITLQPDAVEQIGDNILAFEAGQPMHGVVDFSRGY